MPKPAARLEPVVEIPVAPRRSTRSTKQDQSTTGPTSSKAPPTGRTTRSKAQDKHKGQEAEASPELGVDGEDGEEDGDEEDSDEEVVSSLIPNGKGKGKAVEQPEEEELDELDSDLDGVETDYDAPPPASSTSKNRSPTKTYGKKGRKSAPKKGKEPPAPPKRGRGRPRKDESASPKKGGQPKKKKDSTPPPSTDEDQGGKDGEEEEDEEEEQQEATPPPANQQQQQRQPSSAPQSPRKHLFRRVAGEAAVKVQALLKLPRVMPDPEKEARDEEEDGEQEEDGAEEGAGEGAVQENEQEDGQEDEQEEGKVAPNNKKPPAKGKRKKPAQPPAAASGSSQKSPPKKKTPKKKKVMRASQPQQAADGETEEHDNGQFSGLPAKSQKNKKRKRTPPPAAEFNELEDDPDDGYIALDSDVDEPDEAPPPKLFMHLNVGKDGWLPDRIWLHDDAEAWDRKEFSKEKWAERIERQGGKVREQPDPGVYAVLPKLGAVGYANVYEYAKTWSATPVTVGWLKDMWSASTQRREVVRLDPALYAAPPPPNPAHRTTDRRFRQNRLNKSWGLTRPELRKFAELFARWKDPEERGVDKLWVLKTMQDEFHSRDRTNRTTITGFNELFKLYRQDIVAEAERLLVRAEKRREAMERMMAEEEEEARRMEFSPDEEEGEGRVHDGLEGAEAGPSQPKRRKRQREEEQGLPDLTHSMRKRWKNPNFNIGESDVDLDDSQDHPTAVNGNGASPSPSVPPPRRPLRGLSPSQGPSRDRSPFWMHSPAAPAQTTQLDLPLDDLPASLALLATHFSHPLSLVRRINLACSFSLPATERILFALQEMAADQENYERLQALHEEIVGLCWSKKADLTLLEEGEGTEKLVGETYGKSEEEVRCRKEEVLGVLGVGVVDEQRWFPTKKEVKRILDGVYGEE